MIFNVAKNKNYSKLKKNHKSINKISRNSVVEKNLYKKKKLNRRGQISIRAELQ